MIPTKNTILIITQLFISSHTLFSAETEVERKPNIVFIMVDDLGPGWVDFDGSNERLNTPSLQKMAENGIVFTRAYAAASVCSPTRAACITGMSPAQIGLTTHIPGAAGRRHSAPKGGPIDAPSINQLPLELPSYARELKKLGYATTFIGKWHLAGEGSVKTTDGIVDSKFHPEYFGFDRNIGGCAYGQPKSWFDPYKNGTIENREKGQYLTDRLADETIAFIKENKDKPFLVNLWPYNAHRPFKAPKELFKKNDNNHYFGMLEALDLAVGRILTSLEELKLSENTLVVFYSDNGGEVATKGLAEFKGSLLEGGLRVPMVATWPAVMPKGESCAEPVTSMDFFPTFVHMAGGNTTNIKELEGMDLMPLFKGEKKLPKRSLYWHYPHNRKKVKYNMGGVVLSGDLKFYHGYGIRPNALFDLEKDPMEKTNLIKKKPSVAKSMLREHKNWLKKVGAKMPPEVK